MRITLVLGALLALSTGLAHGQEYTMKAEEAQTGSHLKRNTTRLHFPPDKTYAELPEADKARMRAMYEAMGPNDEPPYPLRGYGKLLRSISTAGGALQVEGVIEMGVIVGTDGRANEVKVYRSPDARTTTAMASVLMLEKYKPAVCDGKPCVQEFPFAMEFNLENQQLKTYR
ncbi:hypothetical protein [Pseudoduganella lutea]|uniref:TonB C-terminal domain-containing protein n=1 Tax=Pseudoduganella lutea TaxID=321985 RepID=A0A4P6KY23_9BURK|nr:hypothetical protein [Pseudoduganella lutea]QBE63827.1 hypothetical protein EWM63_13230 [Pseudoduganella lutea]